MKDTSAEQKLLWGEAQSGAADRNATFMDIMCGPNPLTEAEILKLIEKRPARYECFKGFAKQNRAP